MKPDHATLLLNAVRLHQAGKLDEAEDAYQALLASQPDHVDALSLLGTLHSQRGRYQEGIRILDRAIAVNPDYAEAYFNRGLSLQRLGRYEDALNDYHKATMIDPAYAEAFWHKSLILLTLGQYQEGWRLYEWRWKREAHAPRRGFEKPLWLGKQPLTGKTLLLHAEQGFGDVLQFCRYIPMVRACAEKVIFECYGTLARFMQYNFPDIEVRAIDTGHRGIDVVPAHDYHIPLMSVPHAFGTTMETIPPAPYLRAAPEYIEKWRRILAEKTLPRSLRIGLCWAGHRPDTPDCLSIDARRSLHFNRLKPLLEIENMSFVSLQLAPPASQRDDERVLDIACSLQDWHDTAAVISLLDLVISVDTSVCHLSAAMGKYTFLLNRHDTCWRWLLSRDDSPWYPSLTQFRQQTPGHWDEVITRVKEALLFYAHGGCKKSKQLAISPSYPTKIN